MSLDSAKDSYIISNFLLDIMWNSFWSLYSPQSPISSTEDRMIPLRVPSCMSKYRDESTRKVYRFNSLRQWLERLAYDKNFASATVEWMRSFWVLFMFEFKFWNAYLDDIYPLKVFIRSNISFNDIITSNFETKYCSEHRGEMNEFRVYTWKTVSTPFSFCIDALKLPGWPLT